MAKYFEAGQQIKGRKASSKKARRAYSRNSIGVWFRVFRTMTRDAMVALHLPRDPTLRVSLPEASADDSESNSLTPEQLVAFLEAMRSHPIRDISREAGRQLVHRVFPTPISSECV